MAWTGRETWSGLVREQKNLERKEKETGNSRNKLFSPPAPVIAHGCYGRCLVDVLLAGPRLAVGRDGAGLEASCTRERTRRGVSISRVVVE